MVVTRHLLYVFLGTLIALSCASNKEEIHKAQKKVILRNFKFTPPVLDYTWQDNSFLIHIKNNTSFRRFAFNIWMFVGKKNQTVYEGRSLPGIDYDINTNTVAFTGIDLKGIHKDSILIHLYLILDHVDLIDLNDKNRRNNKDQTEKVVYIAEPGGKLKPVGDWWKSKHILIDYIELDKLEGEIRDSCAYEIDYLYGPPYEI